MPMGIAMIGAVTTIASGMAQASAHGAEVAAQNKAAKRQDEYNLKLWEFDKLKLKRNYNYQKESVAIARSNHERQAWFQDTVNMQKYNYELMIHNAKHMQAMQQYQKSEQLYNEQLNLNNSAARIATQNQYRRLEEMEMQKAFEFQDLAIDTMQAADLAKVKGGTGRTARKMEQVELMKAGVDSAKLVESLTSGRRDVQATLEEIAQDQAAGNLQAWAQKMLKPGKLPFRPKPLRTPRPTIQDPQKPSKIDYGPKPFKSYRRPDHSGMIMGNAIFNAFGSIASAGIASSAGQGATGGGVSNASMAGGYMQGGGHLGYSSGSRPWGAWGGGSDIRLKENIIKVGKALSGLNIYEWNYKSAPNSRYRGVIAQEVAKIFPEAVRTEPDGFVSVIYDLIDVNMELVT